MSDIIDRIRRWHALLAAEGEGPNGDAIAAGLVHHWWDVDALLQETDRLRERIGEKDAERRDAEERALDAENRLTGARAKLDALEAIVRGLAQVDPYIHGSNAPWTCITCTWAEVDTETAVHEPWCAWRRAREWVDQHPATDTGSRE